MRQYAASRLDGEELMTARRAHATWAVEFAERAHAANAAARWVEGRLTEARALAERGLVLAGGPTAAGAGPVLSLIGDSCLCSGDLDDAATAGDRDPDRAQRLLPEAIALAEAVDNRLVAGIARTTAVSLRGRQARRTTTRSRCSTELCGTGRRPAAGPCC